MPEYFFNITLVEELQMISDTEELEKMFGRAKSVIVQGGSVVLIRKLSDGKEARFDEFTTEADLGIYKQSVFKYL